MERSLYERLGGIDSITAVVEDFRDRVARDDRINQKFARTDLGRLTKILTDQVCEAAGGPCTDTGRSMKEAHAGMRVTTGEFDALVADLVATLNQFKVGRTEQDEVLGVLGPLEEVRDPADVAFGERELQLRETAPEVGPQQLAEREDRHHRRQHHAHTRRRILGRLRRA